MSKKSKGFSDLLAVQQGRNNLRKKVDRFDRDLKLIETGDTQEKMSDVLAEFLSPYEDMVDDKQGMQMLYSMGVVGWNLALMPIEKRTTALDDLLSGLNQTPDETKVAKSLIQELIDRKERLFANNHRYIVEFDLQQTSRHDYHVTVASTMPS